MKQIVIVIFLAVFMLSCSMQKEAKQILKTENTEQQHLNTEQQAVSNTLQKMFDMMQKNDVEESRKLFIEDGQYHRYDTKTGEIKSVSFKEYLKNLELAKVQLLERFWNPTVLVDGNLATLFTRYEFFVNNTWSHCGVEVFTFLKVKGKWKISGSAFTTQTENCPENH